MLKVTFCPRKLPFKLHFAVDIVISMFQLVTVFECLNYITQLSQVSLTLYLLGVKK